MLSAEYVQAELKPSFLYCLVAAFIGIMAGFALLCSGLTPLLSGSLLLAVLVSLTRSVCLHGLRIGETAVTDFRGTPDALVVKTADGSRLPAKLDDYRAVTPIFVLIVLRFEDGTVMRTPVLRDAMMRAAFRRLCVFLDLSVRP